MTRWTTPYMKESAMGGEHHRRRRAWSRALQGVNGLFTR
jgi:hypothetical protein